MWSLLPALLRVRVIGADRLPKTNGALITANHISYAGAVLLGSATRRWILTAATNDAN